MGAHTHVKKCISEETATFVLEAEANSAVRCASGEPGGHKLTKNPKRPTEEKREERKEKREERREKREERGERREEIREKREEIREKRYERREKREERGEKREERREKREDIPREAARSPHMRPQEVPK